MIKSIRQHPQRVLAKRITSQARLMKRQGTQRTSPPKITAQFNQSQRRQRIKRLEIKVISSTMSNHLNFSKNIILEMRKNPNSEETTAIGQEK